MGWNIAGNIKGPQGIQGPAGAQGTPGATGAQGPAGPVGPAGLNWRGAWAGANTYAINDAVGWGGSSYFATANKAANSLPPTGTAGDPGADDTALNPGWALLATEGAKGATGATGATGPTGATGAQGATGADGPAGATGQRGSKWFVGTGAPSNLTGTLPGDQYLDQSTGDVYTLS